MNFFALFDYVDSVDSTNNYLKAFVDEGRERLVVAGEQTGGKGRFGRHWLSLPSQGLYASFLFYPGIPVRDGELLNRLFSVAVAETLCHFDRDSLLEVTLKAPNDVLANGKKVCGILVEVGSVQDEMTWAIAGIGVNLYHDRFPCELEEKATSLKLLGLEVPEVLDFCSVLTERIVSLRPLLKAERRGELSRKYESRLK